ncbi:peptidoglycan DD-metalloendopeptidase family protein [Kitasatospora sp. NPDC096147]|uniref:M23 family metallopeptidase n=1 Tax=Kitasatospora sp. NPDC096147 TaxID=3364093 RepID=UPI0038004E72
MSVKGKHRRVQLSRLTRIAVATGVVGAAFAVPVSAASAHQNHTPAAAPEAAVAVAPQAAPAAVQASAPAAAPAAEAKAYQVVSGDTLSKIANAQQVEGGWEKLYQDNRTVIGGNPNLIFPGQNLSLAGKAAVAAPAPAQAPAPQQSKSEDTTKASRSKASTPAPKAATPKAEAPKAAAPKAEAPKAAAAPKATTPKAAAPKAETSTTVASGGYVAPVSGGTSTAYHASGSSWSSGYHTGVDFRASTGTSVKAVTSGTVVKAGNGGAYGNEVVIRHADGKYSEYAHLSSIGVSAGQTVSAGQQIGLSGATGNVTGPHLHFEIRTGASYGSDIDPVSYLRAHGVNL